MKPLTFASWSRRVAVCLQCALFASPGVAFAEPTRPAIAPLESSLPPKAAADYQLARTLYTNGDYSGALKKFQEAFGEAKEPRLLFNMALCERNLHAYARTQTLLQRYEREAAPSLSESDRTQVDQALATLANLVGSVRLTVNESGATVSVDGEPAGTAPLADAIVLDLGTHQLQVSKPGFEAAVQRVEVTGGVQRAIGITLAPVARHAQLFVKSDDSAMINLDGKVVAAGHYNGNIAPGVHELRVTEPSMKAYRAQIDLKNGETRTLEITLEAEKRAAAWWPWVVGGAVVAAGAAVGGYFAFRSPSSPSQPAEPTGSLGGVRTLSWHPRPQ